MVLEEIGGQGPYGHPHQSQQAAKYHPNTKIHPYPELHEIQFLRPTSGAIVTYCRDLE